MKLHSLKIVCKIELLFDIIHKTTQKQTNIINKLNKDVID
jgi:hypothetical protein